MQGKYAIQCPGSSGLFLKISIDKSAARYLTVLLLNKGSRLCSRWFQRRLGTKPSDKCNDYDSLILH